MLNTKIKFNIGTILLTFAVLVFPYSVFSSTLSLVSDSHTYNVGEIIKIKIILNTDKDLINAVSANLKFSQDSLTLVSVSKQNSILDIWAQEPVFSNSFGQASFEGVALSPQVGNSLLVATLNFKAINDGSASVSIDNGLVLASDGLGTNTLNFTNDVKLSILNPIIKAPTIKEKNDTSIKELIQESFGGKPVVEETKKPILFIPDGGLTSSNGGLVNYFVIIITLVILLLFTLYLYFNRKSHLKRKINNMSKILNIYFNVIEQDEKQGDMERLKKDMAEFEKIIQEDFEELKK